MHKSGLGYPNISDLKVILVTNFIKKIKFEWLIGIGVDEDELRHRVENYVRPGEIVHPIRLLKLIIHLTSRAQITKISIFFLK
jgi:hypothetical protein